MWNESCGAWGESKIDVWISTAGCVHCRLICLSRAECFIPRHFLLAQRMDTDRERLKKALKVARRSSRSPAKGVDGEKEKDSVAQLSEVGAHAARGSAASRRRGSPSLEQKKRTRSGAPKHTEADLEGVLEAQLGVATSPSKRSKRSRAQPGGEPEPSFGQTDSAMIEFMRTTLVRIGRGCPLRLRRSSVSLVSYSIALVRSLACAGRR